MRHGWLCRSLAVIGALVLFPLATINSAAAAGVPPTPSFDYSMPPRFGLDNNNDGLIDYVDGATDATTGYSANPSSWHVDLNACASTVTGTATYAWRVVDQPNPLSPIAVQGGPACDKFFMTVPEEGTYRVELQVADDNGTSNWLRQEVVVQDFLIVSLGDSYGSGEGVPDIPLDSSSLDAAQAAWQDVQDKWNALMTIQADATPIHNLIDQWNAINAQLAATDCLASTDNAALCADLAGQLVVVFGQLVVAVAAYIGDVVGETVSDIANLFDAAVNAAQATWQAATVLATNLTQNLTATWENKQCHRSANSGSARAAKQIEDEDPHTSVTFVHLACSGATMTYGLLGWYTGAEPTSLTNAACNPAPPATPPVGCIPPQVDTAKQLIGNREVDALYISIGGNDAHFADIAIACIVEQPCTQPNLVSDPGPTVDALCNSLSSAPNYAMVLFEGCKLFAAKLPAHLLDTAPQLIDEGLNGDTRPPIDPMFPGLPTAYASLKQRITDTGLLPPARSPRTFLSEYVDAAKSDDGSYCDTSMGLADLPGFTIDEWQYIDQTIETELYAGVHAGADANGWTYVDGVRTGTMNHGYCATDHYLVRMLDTFFIEGRYNGMVHPNYKGHGAYKAAIYNKIKPSLYPGGVVRRPAQAAYADAGGPYTVAEGSSVTLANESWDSNGDPMTFAWSQNRPGLASLSSATTPAPTLTGVDDTTGTVGVTVSDVDGSRSDSAAFTVTNVAPTVNAGAAVSIGEGQAFTGSATFSDPGVLDTHTAVIDYGDGTIVGPAAVSGGAVSLSHAWKDEGSYALKVTVTDDDGGVGTSTRAVTVSNAAPVVTGVTGPVAPILVGTTISASATFTDAGVLDTHSATWAWGDGATSLGAVTETAGSGSVAGSHTYAATGIYTVTVTVNDHDGGVTPGSYEYVVVYDPTGGFATGGGWFTSPAGAYLADPAAVGMARFGFVSKYKKGTTIPTGDTGFEFKAGGLQFRSTSYDWLVISGSRVTYQGSGSLSGVGGYLFQVSGYDGGAGGSLDKIRVRIWVKRTGAVVYDTQPGAKLDAAPTTSLGGGVITIQAK